VYTVVLRTAVSMAGQLYRPGVENRGSPTILPRRTSALNKVGERWVGEMGTVMLGPFQAKDLRGALSKDEMLEKL